MDITSSRFKTTIVFALLGLYWFSILLPPSDSGELPLFFSTTFYFLPGINLPLATILLFRKKIDKVALIYLIFSVLDYVTMIWMFSAERIWTGFPYLATFMGSLIFLILTKKYLNIDIKYQTIITCSFLAAFGFVFYNFYNERIAIAIACLMWNVFVGLAIDFYKRQP